jgi:molybdopterin converting factor small subunit
VNGLSKETREMQITVRVFSVLRSCVPPAYRGKEGNVMDLPERASVAQALEMMSISKEEVVILLVNGRYSGRVMPLSEGDVLSVFPPISGG